MKMINNKGYNIENRMKVFFKGKDSIFNSVDFETSTTFYEVKSCQLFIACGNGNHKRKYKDVPHKKITTFQHGRFHIIVHNHTMLKALADEHNKKCKYIFAFGVGKQIIWRVLDWNDVVVDKDKEFFQIPITKIFGGIE